MQGTGPKGPGPGEDPTPTYNNYVRGTLGKGESPNYADQLQALAALKSYDEKQADAILRSLSRLLQYGHLNIAGVQLALQMFQLDIRKDDKALMRVVQYLVHLGLGDGTAGTPLPVPAQAGGQFSAKAVDRLGLDVLVGAWSALGNERAEFGRKQAALRSLAAVTRASLTSKPDDATYVHGLYETLRGLLDKMDALRASRRGLAHIINQAQGNKKKNLIADYRQRAEMWGLMRVAFSAARLALPRSGLYKIAPRSLTALGSSDPVCARHAMALASLVARDPAGAGSFIAAVEPMLRHNVDAAKRTGALHLGVMPAKRSAGAGAGAGDDSESHLNLRDTWARVYLARACAAVIQSGHIAGDLSGRGAVFWQALLLLAVADPSERVALEAVRAMFGAPYPRATSAAGLRQPGGGVRPGATPAEVEAEASQSKIYGASWHMIMSVAMEQPPVPEEAPEASAGKSGPVGAAGVRAEDTCVFGRVARRLFRCLQSRSHSLVCGAARAAAVMAEARCWFHALSGGHGHEAEPEAVRRWMRNLYGFLSMLAGDDSVSGCERAAALEALVWSQGLDQPPTLTAGLMLRAASYGGFTAEPIVRYTFADPWPEGLVAEVLTGLSRRLRCTAGMPPELVLELAGGLGAGSPAGMPRDALQALWEAAPGPLAVRSALQLLGAPLPPLAHPPASAAVEVKALACKAEAAFNGLKAMAACWLGEHANSVAGEYAWKSWEHKLGPKATENGLGMPSLESASSVPQWQQGGGTTNGGARDASAARRSSVGVSGGPQAAGSAPSVAGAGPEDAVARMAVAGVAHNPLLAMVISHLHRATLTAAPPVRVASCQALAKLAVRSGEPYRIQCYSLLAAAAALGGGGGPGGGCDPLGLAPVAGPALEVLDAMYAGELVLERAVAQYGPRAAGWPAPALAALRRRHEWLLGALACTACAVPRELYLPLGPRSRRLIFPDEKEEAEEAARAAAAAQAPQAQEGADGQYAEGGYEQQQYDEYGQPYQYDYANAEQYDYGDYYNQQQEQQDPYGNQKQAQDPLDRYDWTGQKAAAAVELHWRGDAEQDDSSYAADAAGDAASESLAEARPGVVVYAFAAETEEEVSVSAGDHVRVLHDLGDWLQVAAPGGARGLVPASYVQLQDEQQQPQRGTAGGGGQGNAAARASFGAASSFGGGRDSVGPASGLQGSYSFNSQAPAAAATGTDGGYYPYQYDNPEYDVAGADAAYGNYYGDYGADQYGAGAYGDGAYGGGGMYGSEQAPDTGVGKGGGKKGGFGGFDDFGAVLAAAKTAATATRQQAAPLMDSAARDSSSATATTQEPISALPQQPQQSYEASPSAAAGAYGQGSPAETAASPSPYGYGYEGGAAADDNPWASTQQQGAEYAESGAAVAQQGTGRATALYEFVAEMEGELSVSPGEELEVGEEVDGWYAARVVSDGRQGLIPASYVQLQ